jgi:hypothetical protein
MTNGSGRVPGNIAFPGYSGSYGYGGATGANAGTSGLVVFRYLTAAASSRTITGGTETTSGSYTLRTFTSAGSLVIGARS